MGKFPNITQPPCSHKCGWSHPEGITYDKDSVFAGMCPILYHTLYPYFLGLLYHADMQDIWVCCPAEKGVDVLVRRETNNGQFINIPDDWWVIYAEIVKIGSCPYKHYVGEKLVFPTYNKQGFMCPAGVNNILPFLTIEIPPCINLNNLRCPDWKVDVFYKIEEK